MSGAEALELASLCPSLGDVAWMRGQTALYPALKVLPMGWSWSFHFAQVAHSFSVQQTLQLGPGELLLDRQPVPPVDEARWLALPYCDNLSVGSASQAKADDGRKRMSAHQRSLGFRVHEETEAALHAAPAGFALDGLQGHFSVTRARA